MRIEIQVRKNEESLGGNAESELLAMRMDEKEHASPLVPEAPGFEDIMKIATEGMGQYSNALRELAK